MSSLARCITLVTTLIALTLSTLPAHVQSPTSASRSSPRTLAAVFAHPDDESMVGPLLAAYARRPDTRVFLVIVTNGDKGVTPFAKIPAGEALAAVRVKEARCACDALGIQPPVLLGLPDGGLASSQALAEAADKLGKVLGELKPDAIVTWGPDGGYGHPDHRLVSAVVTQLVQTGEMTPWLYYAGLPRSRLQSDALRELRFPAPFAPVADDLLNTRVPYTAEDAGRARTSLACHTSQFPPQSMALISKLTDAIHAGSMHLRLWTGGPRRSDVFER